MKSCGHLRDLTTTLFLVPLALLFNGRLNSLDLVVLLGLLEVLAEAPVHATLGRLLPLLDTGHAECPLIFDRNERVHLEGDEGHGAVVAGAGQAPELGLGDVVTHEHELGKLRALEVDAGEEQRDGRQDTASLLLEVLDEDVRGSFALIAAQELGEASDACDSCASRRPLQRDFARGDDVEEGFDRLSARVDGDTSVRPPAACLDLLAQNGTGR